MTRRSSLALIVLAALAGPVGAQESQPPNRAEAIARRIEARVSGVRGLAFRKPTRIGVYSADQLRALIQEKGREDVTPAELEGSSRALVKLGLLPPGTDLEALMVNLLSEQVAGFYDPEKKELFLVDQGLGATGPGGIDMEEMIMSHELVHALQDQHFDLTALQSDVPNDDVRVAITSLVEGDATLSMMLMDPQAGGMLKMLLPFLPTTRDGMRGLAALSGALGGGGLPGEDAIMEAPAVIADEMIFSYYGGAKLCGRLLGERRGDAFDFSRIDAAFRRPPLSTEQVLHPDRFLGDAPDWPTAIALPDLGEALGSATELIHENTLGELHVRTLLQTHEIDGAARAHAGWDGDRYALFAGASGPDVLVWATTWDSETDAAEFAEAIRAVLRKRFPDDFERGALRQRDADVFLVLDAPEGRGEAVMAALLAGTVKTPLAPPSPKKKVRKL